VGSGCGAAICDPEDRVARGEPLEVGRGGLGAEAEVVPRLDAGTVRSAALGARGLVGGEDAGARLEGYLLQQDPPRPAAVQDGYRGASPRLVSGTPTHRLIRP
jgi:hypothetical protein